MTMINTYFRISNATFCLADRNFN